jgi:hypothetical protein
MRRHLNGHNISGLIFMLGIYLAVYNKIIGLIIMAISPIPSMIHSRKKV